MIDYIKVQTEIMKKMHKDGTEIKTVSYGVSDADMLINYDNCFIVAIPNHYYYLNTEKMKENRSLCDRTYKQNVYADPVTRTNICRVITNKTQGNLMCYQFKTADGKEMWLNEKYYKLFKKAEWKAYGDLFYPFYGEWCAGAVCKVWVEE